MFGFVGILAAMQESRNLVILAICPVMALFAIALTHFGFKLEAKKSKEKLARLIAGSLDIGPT